MQNSVVMTCIDKLCTGKATLECDSGSVTIGFVCLIYLFMCHHTESSQTESGENVGLLDLPLQFPICELVSGFFLVQFESCSVAVKFLCLQENSRSKIHLPEREKAKVHPLKNVWAKVHPHDFSILGSLAAASL